MAPGAGSALMRITAVIPVVLLVLFTGLLWLLGYFGGRERRRHVTTLSQQAMGTAGALLHGPSFSRPTGARTRARRR
jgi:hypothetical protein